MSPKKLLIPTLAILLLAACDIGQTPRPFAIVFPNQPVLKGDALLGSYQASNGQLTCATDEKLRDRPITCNDGRSGELIYGHARADEYMARSGVIIFDDGSKADFFLDDLASAF